MLGIFGESRSARSPNPHASVKQSSGCVQASQWSLAFCTAKYASTSIYTAFKLTVSIQKAGGQLFKDTLNTKGKGTRGEARGMK